MLLRLSGLENQVSDQGLLGRYFECEVRFFGAETDWHLIEQSLCEALSVLIDGSYVEAITYHRMEASQATSF